MHTRGYATRKKSLTYVIALIDLNDEQVST
jgi:hypothetical protein